MTTWEDRQSPSSYIHVAVHLLTSDNCLLCLFFIHISCGRASTYHCERVNCRLVGPSTNLSCLATTGNARAKEKDPFVSVRDAAWLKTSAVNRQGRLTERFDEATINENKTKIATAHSHALQRGEKNSSVIAKVLSEMKRISIFSKNRSDKKLFLLAS